MIKSQIRIGVVLNYIIIALNTLVGLLFTPYLLRMLGKSEWGLYALVSSVIGYLTLLDFGFGNAIIRYTSKFRSEGKKKEQYEMFGMFFILYSFLGLLVVIGGVILYLNVENIFANSMTQKEIGRVKIMMTILVFNLFITFPLGLFSSIVSAYERFVFQRIVSLIRIVLNCLIMIAVLYMGYKAIALCIVTTFFNLATLFADCIYAFKRLKIRLIFRNFQYSFVKEVVLYSFWIFLNIIVDRVYWSTGQFVLGAVSGTIAVAVFAVGIKLQGMYMQLSNAVVNVFLPKVTRMVASDSSDKEISDLFIRTGRIQYIVLAFILSGFILFGEYFISIWAGEGYEDAYIITLLFFISLVIPLIQNMGITILQARNEMKFRSILYVCIAIVSFIFQIILSKKFGAVGCSVAIAISLLIGNGFIMNIYYSKFQRIEIIRFWKEIIKMSIVPAVMVILGCLVNMFWMYSSITEYAIEIVVFSIIYIPLFWRFSMNKSEHDLLKGLLSFHR